MNTTLLIVIGFIITSSTVIWSIYRINCRYAAIIDVRTVGDMLSSLPFIESHTIPKVVYFTYNDMKSVPQKVMDNIKTYCAGLEVQLFDDTKCTKFLLEYFGSRSVDIFNGFQSGAHKADFWRFCILYVFGGFYFDIKTDFQLPAMEIFDVSKTKTWYTVICAGDGDQSCIYNGIIVTPPRNPVIKRMIEYMWVYSVPEHYMQYVTQLRKILAAMIPGPIVVGPHKHEDWTCILFEEKCVSCGPTRTNLGTKCDKYGLDCKIYDARGTMCFKTRYPEFPW